MVYYTAEVDNSRGKFLAPKLIMYKANKAFFQNLSILNFHKELPYSEHK